MYKIEISERTLHFKQPAGTSRGVYTTRHSYYLTLTSDEMPGIEGVGECATLPDLSCDAKPEYAVTLRQVCQMVEQMGRIPYDMIRAYPSITFGLETAFASFFYAAKKQGVSVSVPAGMENLASFKKRLASADLVKTKVFPIIVGATANLKQFQLLHPILPGNGTNECSLVLWYNFNQTSCLFMGDLDKQNELALLARYPQLQATVLKAGHHGSKTSSDSRFVAKVNPSLVIISAGRHNRCGHPHLETITTLKQQGIPYLVTAQTGMIKLRTGFTGVRVQNFAQMTGQNNFISQD